MALIFIKAEPKVEVVSMVTTTRTLELNDTQVENIVRLWAKAEAGFKDPNIEIDCLHDGILTGVTITEVTETYVDDSDTPIEGD
jgi:hypothetical protein|tara:strand:+ start:2984 stop:3235 length:252 start_codon:yes stop_codon:yes gene_type:complete